MSFLDILTPLLAPLTGAVTSVANCGKAYLDLKAKTVGEDLASQIDQLSDEIFTLGDRSNPGDELRIELLNSRRQRKRQLLGALQSPGSPPVTGGKV